MQLRETIVRVGGKTLSLALGLVLVLAILAIYSTWPQFLVSATSEYSGECGVSLVLKDAGPTSHGNIQINYTLRNERDDGNVRLLRFLQSRTARFTLIDIATGDRVEPESTIQPTFGILNDEDILTLHPGVAHSDSMIFHGPWPLDAGTYMAQLEYYSLDPVPTISSDYCKMRFVVGRQFTIQ